MAATIKDIAKIAKISTATVSRILSDKKGHFSEQTAIKVRKIAKELGYHKNSAAAELVTKKSNVIAVIVNSVNTNFSKQIIQGIEKTAVKNSYNVIILDVEQNNLLSEQRAIKTILERPAYGILVLSVDLTLSSRQMLNDAQIPYLFISIALPQNSNFIASNDFQIGYQAASFLINKGHRKIGLAAVDPQTFIGQQRIAGYQQALQDHEIIPDDNWIQPGNFTYQSGIAAMNNYYQLASITAVIGGSDLASIGLLNAATNLDLKIPADLSILSIDGTFLTQIVQPPLSCVKQAFYKMGLLGADLLLNEKQKVSHSIYLPFKIIERDSISTIK